MRESEVFLMRNTKRELNPYSFYDTEGLARHFERMAAEGWAPDRVGLGNFKLKIVSRHQPLINHFPIKFAIRLGCSTISHTSQSICLRFGGWNLNPSSGQCSILPVSCKLAAILP